MITLRTLTLLVMAAVSAPALAQAASGAKPAAKQPNIIVIVSDDQGYADAGFQGAKDIPTPQLDALASAGVRCTRGYVTASVCSPSRAALLTGRYQQRFGHHNNIVADTGKPGVHTPLDETLLPQVLAKAGYHTAMVGKWHIGNQEGTRPYERGFQEFFGIITGGHDYFINDPAQVPDLDSRYKARIERNGPVGEKVPGYLTDAFADDAVRVIRESHTKRPGKPLFLYLAFNAPHTPNQAPQELVDAMPDTHKGKDRRAYIAQISSMDTAIGKVRAALKETGMDKDTFIIYFSDNGGANFPFYDNTPLRSHKGSVYEGGIRVPFLAAFPGRIPAGGKCDLPVTSLDVFATASKMAGVDPQTVTDSKHPLDSVDMLPVLEGKAKQATHKALFWDFPGSGKAISMGNLKLIVTKAGDKELYDLDADVGEKNNLASARPQDVARLEAVLQEWSAQNMRPRWGTDSGAKVGPKQKTTHDGDLVGETAK